MLLLLFLKEFSFFWGLFDSLNWFSFLMTLPNGRLDWRIWRRNRESFHSDRFQLWMIDTDDAAKHFIAGVVEINLVALIVGCSSGTSHLSDCVRPRKSSSFPPIWPSSFTFSCMVLPAVMTLHSWCRREANCDLRWRFPSKKYFDGSYRLIFWPIFVLCCQVCWRCLSCGLALWKMTRRVQHPNHSQQ